MKMKRISETVRSSTRGDTAAQPDSWTSVTVQHAAGVFARLAWKKSEAEYLHYMDIRTHDAGICCTVLTLCPAFCHVVGLDELF